ncbi:similar to Saccharomyces cerevisiae YOR250C CLP1 Subunit of cleavage factor I (CFI), involved in both the endonucleolyitc cleavage and polyadenylation steps of mRNA 3'-end maturation [Maudiozyma saulgeensis]|uniref:Polynucleotide 5'-hydroxyl-kinase GRC3 n=1 Tax=Maudiozyma saulgeensis TaxID=1789683 RepID=A0A1X7R4G9_9SACH|nr:similar to Saccharomyces cerevisiae YOR250C CLP1 Subunit of cleavage factor I (CFI), involved in both the endonucleolyitc cleavage and polyadenylation steps of mRNA 3'-end maturation [Kazachstania saulgeensis]
MSFLPGLTEEAQVPDIYIDVNEVHTQILPMGTLWKIKVPSESKMSIKILTGIAEIFGTELANNIEYNFQNWNFTVYAVEEVYLEWKGTDPHPAVEGEDIIPNDSAKNIYNLHFALEKMRNSTFDGPKVMIIGNKRAGKTALCRTLCSYTIKFKSYQPMFINLNPQESIFSPPGCLSATPISDILDVQLPIWGQSMTSGATALHSKQPLLKLFGLEMIPENRELYMATVKMLAEDVSERLQRDALIQRSGCIINTPPLSQLDDTLKELVEIIHDFKVNLVIMIADESNDDDMAQFERVSQVIKPFVGDFLLRLPRLTGVIESDDTYERSQQRNAIREYFYGNSHTALSPFSVSIDYEDLVLWEPMNLLDPGSNEVSNTSIDKLELRQVQITPSVIQHALICITFADKHAKANDVSKSSILGFALVTEVNEKRRKVRILIPVPGNFPNCATLLTSYRYLE